MNISQFADEFPLAGKAPLDPCIICRRLVDGFEPRFCCDGYMCGCRGEPISPCVCSRECESACYMFIGYSYEQRRIMAGIPVREDKETGTYYDIPFQARMIKQIEILNLPTCPGWWWYQPHPKALWEPIKVYGETGSLMVDEEDLGCFPDESEIIPVTSLGEESKWSGPLIPPNTGFKVQTKPLSHGT